VKKTKNKKGERNKESVQERKMNISAPILDTWQNKLVVG